MREIFTTVQQAVASGKDPVSTLERYRGTARLNKVGLGIFDRLSVLAGKGVEWLMEELIKTSLK